MRPSFHRRATKPACVITDSAQSVVVTLWQAYHNTLQLSGLVSQPG